MHHSFDNSAANSGSLGAAANIALNGGAVLSETQALAGSALYLADSGAFAALGSQGAPLGATWTAAIWFKNLAGPMQIERTLFRGYNLMHLLLVQYNGFIGAYSNYASYSSTGIYIENIGRDGKWHHLAITGHDGIEDVYIDGVYQGIIPFQSPLDIFAIGNYQRGGQRFADYLDEFYLYNRVLSEAEVRAVFNEGRELAGFAICPRGVL